ncbi:hypothetical protein [Marinifilum sp. D714]|uniref:hypothetical protein n=1 Tax=Marinifilum sp. D714 TaxID=2937523 RepID=UPI0027C7D35A|nr:hypothetical protein [Marinifilum sp. D714]MDQ2177124.1 hypothetical protein [Marinifilum sp. D714]
MKNTLITTLKGRPILKGELLFDDHKISFRNDPGLIGMIIMGFSFLSFSSAYSLYSHYHSTDLFDQFIYPFNFSLCVCIVSYLIIKYRKAKRMHDKEFKPEDIKTVYIAKTKRNTKIRFVLNDDFEQYFKFKSDGKCDKLISFLKESEVEIINA